MKLVKRPSGEGGRRHELQDPRSLPPEVVGWVIVKAIVRATAEAMSELDRLEEPRPGR